MGYIANSKQLILQLYGFVQISIFIYVYIYMYIYIYVCVYIYIYMGYSPHRNLFTGKMMIMTFGFRGTLFYTNP